MGLTLSASEAKRVQDFYLALHGIYGVKFTQTLTGETLEATRQMWGGRIARLSESDVERGMIELMSLKDTKKYEWPDVGNAVKLCEGILHRRRREQRMAHEGLPPEPPVRERTMEEIAAEVEKRKQEIGTFDNTDRSKFTRQEWDDYLNKLHGKR